MTGMKKRNKPTRYKIFACYSAARPYLPIMRLDGMKVEGLKNPE
jgi:hypothetical protein